MTDRRKDAAAKISVFVSITAIVLGFSFQLGRMNERIDFLTENVRILQMDVKTLLRNQASR